MAKIESDAKKKVVKYLNYGVDEKELTAVWFNELEGHVHVLIRNNRDDIYFEVTYYDEEGKYIIDVYDIVAVCEGL